MGLVAKQDRKYLELIKRFPLKPIRSDKENEIAAQIYLSLTQILKLTDRFKLSPSALFCVPE